MTEKARLVDALIQAFRMRDEDAEERADELWDRSGMVLVWRWTEMDTQLVLTDWRQALLTLRMKYGVGGSSETMTTEPLVAALLPGLVNACVSVNDKLKMADRVAWAAAAAVISAEQQCKAEKLIGIYVIQGRDQTRVILRHKHD